MKSVFTTIAFVLFCLQLQAQPGSPDKSFGSNGKVLDTSIWADCEAMAVQEDGKIVTGGHTQGDDDNPFGGFYVARFNTDGSIDSSFGKAGKFTVSKIPGALPSTAQAIVLQPDGKIIICGRFIISNPFGCPGLVRLYPDGTVDSSFGINGFVFTRLSEYNDLLGGMVLQRDGKIVVAGKKGKTENGYGDDFLLRYLPDGSLDPEFGSKGVTLTSYITNTDLGAVALQPDGKILTGGLYGVSTRQWQVVRYNPDGSLDKSFGTEGFGRFTAEYYDRGGSQVYSMAIQNDGKIVLGGTVADDDIALVRFDSTGIADASFGEKKGYTVLHIDVGGGDIKSVFYLPSDKKILAAAHYYYDALHQVAALRYNYDGTLDSSYGENGVASGGFADSKYGTDFTSGVGVLQPDGKMIVSGSFLQNDGDTYNVALFRYNGDESRRQIFATRIKRWVQHHGISWQMDNSVRYYNVQRSNDGGITYQPVAKIYNNHQLQYNYEDAAGKSNDLYRVAAVGKDGSRSYSNSVLLTSESSVSVFPNPVRSTMQLQGLPTDSKTSISIVDFTGTVRTTATANGSTCSVNTSNLKPGNYFIKIETNKTITTQPFVKE